MGNPYASPLAWPFASNLFALNQRGAFGYMIPKPKFMYYVEFVINASYQLPTFEHRRLGYLVKAVDRPSIQHKVIEMDQYNRKRNIHTKTEVSSMGIVFYDTVDGAANKMIDDYNRHNFGDYNNMTDGDPANTHSTYWANNAIDGNDMRYWGYRLKNPSNYILDLEGRGYAGADNFFTEIRVYELYGGKFTMFSLMNPKIESVKFDNKDSSSSDVNEVSIMVNPEGVVYRYIDAPLEVSGVAGTFLPGGGFSTNNFPISDTQKTTDFVAGMIGRAGGGLLTGMVNGIFGGFGSIDTAFGGSVGIVGGAAVRAASSGLLGPKATALVNTQNLFQLNSVTSALSSGLDVVGGYGLVKNISYISGLSAGSVSVALAKSSNLGIRRIGNSIASLF